MLCEERALLSGCPHTLINALGVCNLPPKTDTRDLNHRPDSEAQGSEHGRGVSRWGPLSSPPHLSPSPLWSLAPRGPLVISGRGSEAVRARWLAAPRDGRCQQKEQCSL